jgi:hypothetical protein
MIVKGRRGALWDPASAATRQGSLITNPQKWTQAADFGPPAQELTALAYWLQAYFEDARHQADAEYFAHFNDIARDPDWTGILILRATIAQLPPELSGITAGISDTSRFYAHHFAVEISQVANDPGAPEITVRDTSSMFGLIHYVDPGFTEPPPGTPAQPLPPPPGADYDFRVLALKALFVNTAVSRFQSTAQLTLGRLFGSPVVSTGSAGPDDRAGRTPGRTPGGTIVLSGAYQANGDRPVYSLASQADTVFNLASNILPRVEVTAAQLSTRSPSAGTGDVVAWFALSGFLDFAIVEAAGQPFDLLAYGNDCGAAEPRRGLSFSGLGLQMQFPPDDPAARTFGFVTSEIAFDAGTSTPRAGSLLDQFALELDGLAAGGADSPPDQQGFLPVVTDATLRGLAGADQWYGLRFRVNLGSPGKLAGTAGLTASLLVAWSPASQGTAGYAALTGLQLPGTTGGAGLISLENVLKLSVGQLVLTYDHGSSAPPRPGGFLLMLGEIALRLLGLLKLPPSGSTSFYVFGDPHGQGSPSGLGWYAMYQKTPPKERAEPARAGGWR